MEELLLNAKNPVVLLSGGKDSLAVLEWALKLRKVPIITLAQNFSKEQWQQVTRVIDRYDLECHSFPPNKSFVIPNDGLARIDVYGFGNVQFPVLRDFIDGEQCSLELDNQTLDCYPFHYDVVFIGTRKDDWSEATGQPMRESVMDMGTFKLVAPLWDLTRDEVHTEAFDAFIDGDIKACTACLQTEGLVYCPKDKQMIQGFQWDKDAALAGFRQTFGFQGA